MANVYAQIIQHYPKQEFAFLMIVQINILIQLQLNVSLVIIHG